MLNVKLLKKVQKHILEEPRRLQMGSYVVRQNSPGERVVDYAADAANAYKFAPCGTAACIAGWAVELEHPNPTKVRRVAEAARKLLGILPTFDSIELFDVSFWPQPFQERYKNAKTPATRAKIAAARIDAYIADYKEAR